MELPFFCLSKRNDHEFSFISNNDGRNIKLFPGKYGLAKQLDKDILLYLVSQIIAKINAKQRVSRVVRINPGKFLKFSGQQNGGDSYRRLREGIVRLLEMQISTDISFKHDSSIEKFSILESFNELNKDDTVNGYNLELTISKKVFFEITADNVLTVHQEYFQIRKPILRRVYEIGKKHLGNKSSMKMNVRTLKNKCGSEMKYLKEFLYYLKKEIINKSIYSEFKVALDGDSVIFEKK